MTADKRKNIDKMLITFLYVLRKILNDKHLLKNTFFNMTVYFL